MRLFVFNVWGGEIKEDEISQIFVAGFNLKDATSKMFEKCYLKFEYYELDKEVYYDQIIF